MSAHVFQQELDQHLAAGLNTLLTKPVFPERLFETIEAIFADPGDGTQERGFGELLEPQRRAAQRNDLLDSQVLTEDAAMLGLAAVERILSSYRNVLPKHLSDVSSSVQNDDLATLATTAHAIKSAASAVGARRLVQTADDCESAALNGLSAAAYESAGKLASLHEESLAEISNLMDRLQWAAE